MGNRLRGRGKCEEDNKRRKGSEGKREVSEGKGLIMCVCVQFPIAVT